MHLFRRRQRSSPTPVVRTVQITTDRVTGILPSWHSPPATSLQRSELDLTTPIKLSCFRDEDSFETHEGTTVHVHGYSLIWGDRSLSRDEWPKLYPLHVFAFRVAGITYHQQAANANAFVAGKAILLEREPTNSHDANAIRVMSQDRKHHAGFVPKEIAALMAPVMDAARISRALGGVLKTYSVEHHRHGIEVVAAAGRELDLVL